MSVCYQLKLILRKLPEIALSSVINVWRKKKNHRSKARGCSTNTFVIHSLDIGDTALKLVDSVVLKFLENSDIGLFSFIFFSV